MSVFFTSDTHWGHKRMLAPMRPFAATIDEMDAELIRRWNAVVPSDGLTYITGDVSFHGATRTFEILSQLNGVIRLVGGNHDKRLRAKVRDRFEWVKDLYTHKEPDADGHDGKVQRIVLCHFPLRSWDMMHKGAWHLHGHCHGTLPDIGGKVLDIGVDATLRGGDGSWRMSLSPWSYDDIKAVMATRPFVQVDQHAEDVAA